MSLLTSNVEPTSEDVAVFQQAQQHWSPGNQAAAIQVVRPLAESGRPWAAALMAWFLMQQGQPGANESITWAIRAAQLGLPGQTVHTFNNVVGQVPTDPQIANRIAELLEWGLPWASGVDLVGQGVNLAAQGYPEIGLRVMMQPFPMPLTEPQWKGLIDQARRHSIELDKIEVATRAKQQELDIQGSQAHDAIDKARSDLETSARQAGLLVTTVLSDATNSLYKADAARNAKESRGVWRWGLVVLAGAAIVAVLPVVLHYLGFGPLYSAIEQIALHLASTVALATFSGVLLARARSRDRAAQRAHDLSTAMGTMISYSNQISDPGERQRFMATMGQVVLQAHLTTGSGKSTKDDSTTDLLTLANLLRPTLNNTTSPPAS